MRFLIDRCAGRRIADRLKAVGHDVIEARERTPDPGDESLLAWAAAERRVLVTMDKDFGELVYRRGAAHAGIIRLPHLPSAQRVALIEQLLAPTMRPARSKAPSSPCGARACGSRDRNRDGAGALWWPNRLQIYSDPVSSIIKRTRIRTFPSKQGDGYSRWLSRLKIGGCLAPS